MDLNNFDPDSIVKSYYKYKILSDLQNRAHDWILKTDSQDLDYKIKQLEYQQRRKALGMPLTDDMYEKSVNDGFDFKQASVPLLGYFAKKTTLPDLRFFEKPLQTISKIFK